MARNLLAKGHDLTVWNRTRTKADSVIEAGARLASNPAELASQTQVILICVSDTADVEMVVQGPEGILTGLQSDSVVVDHSTISPAATRGLAAFVLAVLAALGLVLETLVGVKDLFAGGEDELTPAIHALHNLVPVFHTRLPCPNGPRPLEGWAEEVWSDGKPSSARP